MNIPTNINELPKVVYHSNGDGVYTLEPHGVGGPISETGLYHYFGNGADYSVYISPKEGYPILHLEGGDVDQFIESKPELKNVPRWQTDQGYFLRVKCDNPPALKGKVEVATGVTLEVITRRQTVAAQGQWVITGELPVWKREQIDSIFNLAPTADDAIPSPNEEVTREELERDCQIHRDYWIK